MNNLSLWEKYWSTCTIDNRNRLVVLYMYLVPQVAREVVYRGIPSLVSREDLIANGYFGLIRAVEKYQILEGSRFEDYARKAIKNEMIDYLRKIIKYARRKTECLRYRDGDIYDVSDYREKSPLDRVIVSEKSFEELVRCLSDVEREIIESVYRDGHRPMDIQKKLGLKQATYGVKHRQALRKIRISRAGS